MPYTLTIQNKMKFIRFSYWLGAILDLFWGIVPLSYMFLSDLTIYGDLGYPSPITDFGYYTLVGVSSLMIGWAILLLWANQKPIERKDTLLITVIVMIVMMVTQIFGFFNGNPFITPVSLLSNTTIVIYALGYYFARNIPSEDSKKS